MRCPVHNLLEHHLDADEPGLERKTEAKLHDGLRRGQLGAELVVEDLELEELLFARLLGLPLRCSAPPSRRVISGGSHVTSR